MKELVEKAYLEAQKALADSKQAHETESISESLGYALRVIDTTENVILPTMLTPVEYDLNKQDVLDEVCKLRVDAYRAAVEAIIPEGSFANKDFSKSMAAFMLAYLMKSGQSEEDAVDAIADIAEDAQLDLDEKTK